MGVSPRRLNGWEPAEVTHHVYEDGVLVRTVTAREPEYTAADLALLLAAKERTDDIGHHGIPMSEAMDSNNQFKYEHFMQRDFAEQTLRDGEERFRKENPDASTHGLIHRVRRRA